MTADADIPKIDISLTTDEAIIPFEFVRRFSDSGMLTIVDQAEVRALWNLCCVFEKSGLSWVGDSWGDTVQQARERLRDEI
jgi:hypothetical protein